MTLLRFGPPLSEEWFAARRGRVTASNAAHLMMDSKSLRWWLDPESLAARMRGEEPAPRNERMDAGQHFEIPNMGWLSYVTGAAVEPDGYLAVDTDRPYIGASVDGWYHPERDPARAHGAYGYEASILVTDEWGRQYRGDAAVSRLMELPDRTPLEMKHVRSKSRPYWNKTKPPEHYEWQVRHQLMVHDADVGLLVCRVDAYELYCHIIERDAGLESQLEAACKSFVEKYLTPAESL